MQEIQLKTPIEYIKEAWIIYTKKENFIFFIRIMAILSIISFIFGLANGYFFPADYLKDGDFSNVPLFVGFILISILSIVFGLWSQSTSYFAVIKMGEPEKEVFKIGFKKILRFLVISFTLGIIFVFGALLLIIPAIIFGVWYSFSMWLVLDKEMGVFESLRASKMLVNGRFWKILGRSAIFGLFSIVISIVVSIVPFVGEFAVSFLSPLFMLPFYLLYRDLSINS
jgi:uncharacterized membrane protein